MLDVFEYGFQEHASKYAATKIKWSHCISCNDTTSYRQQHVILPVMYVIVEQMQALSTVSKWWYLPGDKVLRSMQQQPSGMLCIAVYHDAVHAVHHHLPMS